MYFTNIFDLFNFSLSKTISNNVFLSHCGTLLSLLLAIRMVSFDYLNVLPSKIIEKELLGTWLPLH